MRLMQARGRAKWVGDRAWSRSLQRILEQLVTKPLGIRYIGTVNALTEFYTRQRSNFLAYLIRRTGDYELSCDILQESFLRLFERYGAERLSPQLLYTVGRNLVIDRLRQRKVQTVSIDDHDCSNNQEEHQLLVREEYRQVLAAMSHLEDDERDLLSLLISSGMGYRDLRQLPDLPKPTSRSRFIAPARS